MSKIGLKLSGNKLDAIPAPSSGGKGKRLKISRERFKVIEYQRRSSTGVNKVN
jgi:hypothetical protein